MEKGDFGDADPQLGNDDIPPGYYRDPTTGQLVPIDSTQGQTPSGPAGQPQGGFSWEPGASQPSGAPPGYHWDPKMANFVPDDQQAPITPVNPGVPGSPGPGGPVGGSLIQPFTTPYAPATPQALPTVGGSQTTIGGAPAFPNIPRFAAPSIEEAMADPGYQFVLDQGRNQLQNWAAARGTLNDSSTAKALIDYGQGAAGTQYGNVWDRAFNTYNTNVQTQYLDPWQAQYQNWVTGTVGPTMTNYSTNASNVAHQNDVNWQDNWNKWLQSWNIFRDQRDSTFNKQFTVAGA